MWKIRYNFETLSTQVNIILGPYKVFDPTRWYDNLSGPDKSGLRAKFQAGQFELLCHDLDLMVPIGKDRSKRYAFFQCPKRRIPLVRTGQHGLNYVRDNVLEYVSKTALIMYSTKFKFTQKSETYINNRLSEMDKDKYDLDSIFRGQWVEKHISGESEYFRSKNKAINYRTYIPGVDEFLAYVSIYVSRKQGWL